VDQIGNDCFNSTVKAAAMRMDDTDSEPAMVAGEFFSDGKTFVFRLAGTPLTGIGRFLGKHRQPHLSISWVLMQKRLHYLP
jgi:hypothetical protein